MRTTEEIKRKLWDGAGKLRGSMDASNYKNYMLGLMFYKFLSDKTLDAFKRLAGLSTTNTAMLFDEFKKAYKEYGSELESTISAELGYFILLENLYQKWVIDIDNKKFELQNVADALNDFERRIALSTANKEFRGLFNTSIIDVTNTALGSDLNKRSKNIQDLIKLFRDLNMVSLENNDILGDTYEYLIGAFASDAGKKAGEFYTPRQVSEVMAQIVAKTAKFNKMNPSIYDPTVGSASLLLTVKAHLPKEIQRDLHYYGQEFTTETYNLTRMNLMLHGVLPNKMDIKNGNTLAEDWPEDPQRPGEGVQFDIVVMNPPYSDSNWNEREERPLTVNDPRFSDFGILPPDSKGDYAYLMHGLYHLSQEGTMAIVLPHGVLFRGGAEGEIRKRLIEKNQIDAIIGLPDKMFTNTGIPVCVLILKKNRKLGEDIIVIDSSKNYEKIGKFNVLEEKDIARIVDTYMERKEILGFSHIATRKEIIENDYNLNIPRYVEIIDDIIAHDVEAHLHGGIPYKNIEELKVLKETVPEIIKNNIEEIRPNYVKLKENTKTITKQVLNDEKVNNKILQLKKSVKEFSDKWFKELKNVNEKTDVLNEKEEMLNELKSIIEEVSNVDKYIAYQLLAKIWKEHINNDLEIISKEGFYNAGRTAVPNIIIKKKKKEEVEEQDGWNSALVHRDLIIKYLFVDELNEIEKLNTEKTENESYLEEVRNSLSEEDDEYRILNDNNDAFVKTAVEVELKVALNRINTKEIGVLNEYLNLISETKQKKIKLDFIEKNKEKVEWEKIELSKDGTASKKKVESRIKEIREAIVFEKDSFEEKLKNILEKLSKNIEIDKQIKEIETKQKEKVLEKIKNLTDDEIDKLVYNKWFYQLPDMVEQLVYAPLKKELKILEELEERYSETLDILDKELSILEKSLEEMLKNLVVTTNE